MNSIRGLLINVIFIQVHAMSSPPAKKKKLATSFSSQCSSEDNPSNDSSDQVKNDPSPKSLQG